MTKLPKEKRDRLILLSSGTVILLAVIYFFLIGREYRAIAGYRAKTSAARKELLDREAAIKRQDLTQRDLREATSDLSQAETDVAVGDPNAWIYQTIRNFNARHDQVHISLMSQSVVGNVDLLPHFPYRQLKVTVTGTAYYHDLGEFIADFENTYPHTRILNLSLAPVVSSNTDGATNSEKLTFSMDLVALVKSSETQN